MPLGGEGWPARGDAQKAAICQGSASKRAVVGAKHAARTTHRALQILPGLSPGRVSELSHRRDLAWGCVRGRCWALAPASFSVPRSCYLGQQPIAVVFASFTIPEELRR